MNTLIACSYFFLDNIYGGNKSTLKFCMYKVRKITDRRKNVDENTLLYLNKTEQHVTIYTCKENC